MKDVLYTIGHSNHSPETLRGLLTEARIEILVDIRSYPGSRWAAHTAPGELKRLLQAVGIRYLYLGDLLGGQPSNPDCYDSQTGKADYRAMQNKELFQQGIGQLLELLGKHRVCVMCAEEDPTLCHRNLLVGEALRQKGVQILHIRGNSEIQTDEELWRQRTGVPVNQLQLPLGDA